MSYKIATYITLFLIVILAVVFFFTAMEFSSLQPNEPINPATFPQIISVLLIIMSIISFFTTLRQKDIKVELVNFRYIVYTIIGLFLFVILWELLGYFYILMLILFAILFYIYDDSKQVKRKLLSSIILAGIVSTIIYLLFADLLGVIF
ncbi:tripartite tricarboxylate transporter TctB family protein [Psychrobacillus sp. NPDC093180]|uniref:tripartite tricarboxylate transporter TctB family protein n=1 Tax=Psychrobacillus sp. NPDC093180 TaxID=3364489 RepID=UPI00381F3A70